MLRQSERRKSSPGAAQAPVVFCSEGAAVRGAQPHLDLSFAHDAVAALTILFGQLGFVVALLIAEDPQGLGTFQLNLKLLQGTRECRAMNTTQQDTGLGSS